MVLEGRGDRDSSVAVLVDHWWAVNFVKVYSVRTWKIEARMLKLPLPVRSSTFFFFFSFHRGFAPLSKRGNFGRLSMRFNYLSSYGSIESTE